MRKIIIKSNCLINAGTSIEKAFSHIKAHPILRCASFLFTLVLASIELPGLCLVSRSTHTVTMSPTDTTSSGCFTKRLLSFEIWTSPSCLTPISTNAPKSTTFLTVPCSSIPCFKSSNFNTSVFKEVSVLHRADHAQVLSADR